MLTRRTVGRPAQDLSGLGTGGSAKSSLLRSHSARALLCTVCVILATGALMALRRAPLEAEFDDGIINFDAHRSEHDDGQASSLPAGGEESNDGAGRHAWRAPLHRRHRVPKGDWFSALLDSSDRGLIVGGASFPPAPATEVRQFFCSAVTPPAEGGSLAWAEEKMRELRAAGNAADADGGTRHLLALKGNAAGGKPGSVVSISDLLGSIQHPGGPECDNVFGTEGFKTAGPVCGTDGAW
jgi:hypothetical protein